MFTYGTLEYYMQQRAEKEVILECMQLNVTPSAQSLDTLYTFCKSYIDVYDDWMKNNEKVGEICRNSSPEVEK